MRRSTYRAIAVELLVVAIASMLFFASGCRREEVTHIRVKKAPDATATSVLPGMGRGERHAPQARDGKSGLKWTLPKGWTDSAGSGMRFATLKPPVAVSANPRALCACPVQGVTPDNSKDPVPVQNIVGPPTRFGLPTFVACK